MLTFLSLDGFLMDEQGALWIPTPNFWANRYGHKPTYVILHGTASPNAFYAQDIAHYFQNPSAQSSSHYVVGRDGAVVQCVSEHDAAWGNGIIEQDAQHKADSWWSTTLNPNLITISIEHVQPDSANATGLTDAQKAASFRLIQHICTRWGIPMRQADATGGITGHFSIDPVNRARCPGNYPWAELWFYLQENSMADLSNPTLATYFVLWQGNWKCKRLTTDGIAQPDYHQIRGNILQFYQSVGGVGANGLTLLGLPVEDDHAVLDENGKAYPGVLEQKFERGVVRYDPQHVVDHPPESGTCYLAHVDTLYSSPQKIQSLTQDVAQKNIEITSLETKIAQQTQTLDIASLVEQITRSVLAQLGQSSGSGTGETKSPGQPASIGSTPTASSSIEAHTGT